MQINQQIGSCCTASAAPEAETGSYVVNHFSAARRGQNRFFLLEKKISGSGLRKKENCPEPLEIPSVFGGHLKATRFPSCAAAADMIVTFWFHCWNRRRLG